MSADSSHKYTNTLSMEYVAKFVEFQYTILLWMVDFDILII